MTGPTRFRDTIARRFAATILAAIVVTLALTAGIAELAGTWGRPSFREMGLIERLDDIARMVDAVTPLERPALAAAAANPSFRVSWFAAGSTLAVALAGAAELGPLKDFPVTDASGRRRRIVYFSSDTAGRVAGGLTAAGADPHGAYFLSVEGGDGSWVVFTAETRFWGISRSARNGLALTLLLAVVLGVSAVTAYQLSRPIRQFTDGLRRFGNDPRAAPMEAAGPREVRDAIRAFNAMQAQIQAFVSDRTTMLAAISHDLRTPLTRMRLRGELIQDEEQKKRLFRDVDDMQAMVASALAFFREEFQDEETTTFDLPELLHTVADDFADQGHPVSYDGVEHLAHTGKPFALKRAFGNLVENAVKYGASDGGGSPTLRLRRFAESVEVAILDNGPGIPAEAAEQVFAPFFRLERSRNRSTGGVGLGLTSARAVIQGHGGQVQLRNRPSGGLEVAVSLPAPKQ